MNDMSTNLNNLACAGAAQNVGAVYTQIKCTLY